MHLTTVLLLSPFAISYCAAEFASAPSEHLPQPRTIATGIVRNKPFEGQFRQTYIRKAPDGSNLIRTATGRLARDSQGRMRWESLEGRTATVYDPVKRRMHFLNMAARTSESALLMDAAMESQPGWIFAGLKPAPDARTGLGSVSGISCQRRRFVVVDCPNRASVEVWINEDLRQLMRETLVSGNEELTWTLTDIRLGEPDPSRFEVPEDYQPADSLEGVQALEARP